MITITAEFLDSKWKDIEPVPFLPIALSDWDGGDAFTLAEIGPAPAKKIIYAALVNGSAEAPDFPIIIRLASNDGDEKPFNYKSPDGMKYTVTAEKILNGQWQPIELKVTRMAGDLSSRRAGLIETDALKDKTVVIIGVGTGGSQIAVELVKSGVGKLILIDPDRLEIANVSRHVAGISSVGRKKVNAMKEILLEKNPDTSVEIHAIRADHESQDTVRNVIANADLVIGATDSRQSKLFVNSICVEKKKPVIFAGAHRRAYGGLVLRVRPGESACFHCFVLAMPDIESDREVSSQEDADLIAYSDRPVAVEPGLSIDVLPIALMAAKLGLQELIKEEKSTLHVLDKDFAANWYFWVNRPEPNTQYASWPPLSESSDEMTILRWYGVHLEKDSACPTCGDFEKSMRERYGIQAGMSAAVSIGPLSAEGK